MGIQVNFFLPRQRSTLGLEQAFHSVRAISCASFSVPLYLLPAGFARALKAIEKGEVWLYYFLVREAALNLVTLREVPAQGYWAIDSLRSPVIEFSRCFFDGTQIRSGRLFFDEGYYDDNDAWVVKPAEFSDWANAVKGVAKKLLNRAGNYYYGKEAAVWKNEGKVSFPGSRVKGAAS